MTIDYFIGGIVLAFFFTGAVRNIVWLIDYIEKHPWKKLEAMP